eukprot:jgi/Picsp_1/2768/NSC_00996-R1_type i inositol- -trisphosphate 5-phosphatase 12-like
MDLLTGDGGMQGGERNANLLQTENEKESGVGSAQKELKPRRRPPPPPPGVTLASLSVKEHGPPSRINDDGTKSKIRDEMKGFVPVDGITVEEVHEYFLQADKDKDGRVANEEAKIFFMSSGLPPSVLSVIWRRAKPPEYHIQEKGLDKHQFSQALRLVAFAQAGFDVQDPELSLTAMDPDAWHEAHEALPAPQIAKEREIKGQNDSAAGIYDAEIWGKKDLFEDVAVAEPCVARLLRPSSHSKDLPTLPYEVRYPPLRQNESANLKGLLGINGSLFAYPSFNYGFLQWKDAENHPSSGTEKRSLLMFSKHKDSLGMNNEDNDAAPSSELLGVSHGANKSKQVTCTCMDHSRDILWVADKEGWISGHDMDSVRKRDFQMKDSMVSHWCAYRVGYVTAMTITAIGELWTGSNRGVLRAWSHTSFVSCKKTGSSKAIIPRELRKNSFDRAHSGEILSLQCAANGHIVWSASSRAVLLWDAGSGICFGTLNSQSWIPIIPRKTFLLEQTGVASIDISTGMETDPLSGAVLWRPSIEDYDYCHQQQESWAAASERGVSELAERLTEGAGKAVKMFGKIGGKLAGASTSVRSLESHEGFTDLSGIISASKADIVTMISTANDEIWLGYRDGLLEVFSSSGKLLCTKSLKVAISCMYEIGEHLWIGGECGNILAIDLSSYDIDKNFKAHKSGIQSIAQVGTRAYTLARDGSITGWTVGQSSSILQGERFAKIGPECCKRTSVSILAVTWNVGESRPPMTSPFFRWIKENCVEKSIVVVSLQEVEMGGTSVALAAARETLASKSQERGNANAQFWVNAIASSLGRDWYNVSLRQLSGMLIAVFAKKDLMYNLGDIHTSSVACGILGVGGNKGAVGVQLTLYRHRFAFICSHFAAHQNAVDIRNANYHTIVKLLNFKNTPSIFDEDLPQGEGQVIDPKGLLNSVDNSATAVTSDKNTNTPDAQAVALEARSPVRESPDTIESLRNMDAVIWMGDLNYRIDGNYDQVCQLIAARDFDPLLVCDQLRREHMQSRIFRGYREPQITFAPTYKFDKGIAGELAYDSSEKRRVPAWCDRIMYRGSTPFCSPLPSPAADMEGKSLPSENKIDVSPMEYGSWMDVCDSDHKPVYGTFDVALTVVDASKKREIVSHILSEGQQSIQSTTPKYHISPSTVRLHAFHMPDQMITLHNKGSKPFYFSCIPIDTFDLSVVELRPASGRVLPNESQEIFLKANPARHPSSGKNARMVKYLLRIEYENAIGGVTELHRKTDELTAILLPESSPE